MPELPEVETIRRQLDSELPGATFVAADTHWSEKFTPALDALGATCLGVKRKGKYLLIELDDERELIAHLGMTGAFSFRRPNDAGSEPSCADIGPHVRAVWQLDDGRQLVFDDTRRFGRLRVVDTGDYSDIPTLHSLGPEPLGPHFDGAVLHQNLKKSSRGVKTQLLSQRPVAGVGNIYADEALFRAGIDPRATRIGRKRADRLAVAIRDVLQSALDNGGTTIRNYVDADGRQGSNQNDLLVYGRGGEPCTSCGTALSSIVLEARTTIFCGSCQRR